MGMIRMSNPLAEMDGDEMARVLWWMIKEIVITPFVDLRTEYYDLGMENRERTGDRVTHDAARAVRRLGVGVKSATITPNAQRVEEFGLSRMWPSPNATIRSMLDGTVFRQPITFACVKPLIPTWKEPITVARHAYGDIYKGVEMKVPCKGEARLTFKPDPGEVWEGPDGTADAGASMEVHRFGSPGVLLAMHNLDESIAGFAKSCLEYALDQGRDLWFSTKDTISKVYDHNFKDIFLGMYEDSYKGRFADRGISFKYSLIDDMVAQAVKSRGGFIWACKNYDGDVMSDMVAAVYGSLGTMASVLVSPEGHYEYEAAHGTVTRHYRLHLQGGKPPTNPIASLFTWTGGLRRRGELDGTPELSEFADAVEGIAVGLVESGVMTGDLMGISDYRGRPGVTAEEFLVKVRDAYASSV